MFTISVLVNQLASPSHKHMQWKYFLADEKFSWIVWNHSYFTFNYCLISYLFRLEHAFYGFYMNEIKTFKQVDELGRKTWKIDWCIFGIFSSFPRRHVSLLLKVTLNNKIKIASALNLLNWCNRKGSHVLLYKWVLINFIRICRALQASSRREKVLQCHTFHSFGRQRFIFVCFLISFVNT